MTMMKRGDIVYNKRTGERLTVILGQYIGNDRWVKVEDDNDDRILMHPTNLIPEQTNDHR